MSEPMHADQIARKDFSQSFRGFDQSEVRAYLGQIAAEVAVWQERVEQLHARIAELESTPPPELEEEALEIALGREATRVLHAAREAAADIRTRAEAESAAKVAEADARLAASASEAEAAAERAREDAAARAAAIVEEANAERERVLADLAGRRRALELDLAALQTARDALAIAFDTARAALDAAESGVHVAGDAATAAVDAAPSPAVASAPPRPAPAPVAPEPEPVDVEPEPAPVEREPEPEPEVAPVAVEPEPEPEPEPEAEPEPVPDADRRTSSLKLVRPLEEGRGTPVAPPVEDAFEGVRIIRPEPIRPEPEPEADLDAASAPDPAPEPAAGEDAAVEGLFARLRADRAEKVAHAEAVLATPAPTEEDESAEEVAAETEPEPETASEDVAPDLAVLAARDERLAADERALVRALKRALADEQNEVLDALRRLRGAPAVAGLLPERAAHDARFESVLARGVGIAATAGGEVAGGDGGRAKEVAAELGRSVVTDLRARVERAIEEASGDVETLAEAISSAYREWKTARAEPLARDAITAGFAAGMYAASTGTLRWVVDPAEGGCPDCDDNVLAGATAKGAAYPTGQLHPPAHAGCRCVVVTAS